jgi:glycosyltransferase involved in cell wall biosynthesis
MKILHVLHELKYSGAEIMYCDAAPLFQEKGYELTAMATAKEVGEYALNLENAGYSIMHYELPPLKNIFNRILYYYSIIKLLNNKKFEVVHIHSSKAMWGFALCSRIVKIKSVYTYHNVFPSNFYSYPYHVFLRWSAKHLLNCSFQTISDSVYDHEKNFYFNKTTKIYNWYSNKRYFPGTVEEKNSVRKELGININTLVLISVGGCSDVKRHSDILKALPIILEKRPDTVYLHLGKGISEFDEIKLSKSLGINENVIFCNNQKDVRKFLTASDIYIMPSKFEGISITTIEAMACGIPSILYDVPGLRDFNKNGENSILIPEDYQLLARNVLSLIVDIKKANTISSNALTFVNNQFDMKTNVENIFKIYNKIL